MSNQELLEIHGDGNCHICNQPKIGPGGGYCSYPHGRIPVKAIDDKHPEGFWAWEYPTVPRAERSKVVEADGLKGGRT